jgi:hypothetical protein
MVPHCEADADWPVLIPPRPPALAAIVRALVFGD